MNKIFLSLITLILLLSFSSAIKISPTQTFLTVNQYETNCTYIWILPHENFTINSKWSKDGQGDLSKYVLNPEKIKLEINYSYVSDGKYDVCFTPSQRGSFSGIVYFYSEKSMVEIGTWVELDVESESVFEKISLITGNTIGNKDNQMNLLLIAIVVLLIGILYLVLKRLVFLGKNKHS